MKWILDNTGAFPQRLWFESINELDAECQRLLEYTYFKRFRKKFTPPIGDDELQVLIETHADVDLYAALGGTVEACTDFAPGKRPVIKVNEGISGAPDRRNRLRTGLAHEWFHAVYHRDAWEARWARERLAGSEIKTVGTCLRAKMIGAAEDDWLEYQAGYASCAILMPRTWLVDEVAGWNKSDSEQAATTLVARIAQRFLVSEPAAKWRLRMLNLLPRESDKQMSLL